MRVLLRDRAVAFLCLGLWRGTESGGFAELVGVGVGVCYGRWGGRMSACLEAMRIPAGMGMENGTSDGFVDVCCDAGRKVMVILEGASVRGGWCCRCLVNQRLDKMCCPLNPRWVHSRLDGLQEELRV